jgi:hypothetical protein
VVDQTTARFILITQFGRLMLIVDDIPASRNGISVTFVWQVGAELAVGMKNIYLRVGLSDAAS